MSRAPTTEAEVNKCLTCRYWHRREPQHICGDCRRWPPRGQLMINARNQGGYDRMEITLTSSPIPEWPNTAADDGCGEHAERVA